NAVIIDDEINNINLLIHFIQKYCPLINTVGTASTKDEAITVINITKPKIVFLDIILDEGTGFDLLEEITYKKSKVIFVTAFDEYAIKAFKYNAIDYLLKPIEIEELVLAVNKACKDIDEGSFTRNNQINKLNDSLNNKVELDFIAVPSLKKIDFVKLEDIIYLKSSGRYTDFFLKNNRKITASRNLGEFENIIDKTLFFRIHNSYIVNLRHVLNINKADGNYCKMSTQESIPIAKRRQEALHRFLRIKE
ncbi:MAG: response regulator transcription factor, partial [Flavobacteriaceae bacterium]|nr:response regulator transcription factor [Flavobacteriaceae bacterium]